MFYTYFLHILRFPIATKMLILVYEYQNKKRSYFT